MPQVFRLSGWWRRAAAFAVDGVLVLLAWRVIWSLFNGRIDRWVDNQRRADAYEWRPSVGLHRWTTTDIYSGVAVAAACAMLLVVAAIYAGWFVPRWKGGTPGRRLVGIRVMRAEGQRITVRWAIWRDVFARSALFSVLTVCSFGLGGVLMALWPAWEREARGFEDYLSKSRVVLDGPANWGEAPPSAPAEPAAPALSR